MKKVPLILSAAVLVLLIGSYLLYTKVFKTEVIDIWDLIPNNAIAVYEKDACEDCIIHIQESPVWKLAEKITSYSKNLDSLQERLGDVIDKRKELLISLHATKKDDLDLIYYTSLTETDRNSIDKIFNRKSYRHTEREFNHVKIHEVSFSKGIFSWVLLDNAWVGSFTPFLIEDVIRTSKIKRSGFKKSVSDVRQLPRLKGDAGNIYLQLKNLAAWLSVFSIEKNTLTEAFGKFSILDIQADDSKITLNGFSTDSIDQPKYVLSIFGKQSPVSFNLKHLVPGRALMVRSFGVSDGEKFSSDLHAFVKRNAPQRLDSLQKIGIALNIDIKKLYKSIDNEIGAVLLESSRSGVSSQVLIIETKNLSPWLSTLKTIGEKLSLDTVFYEHYADYEIRSIPIYRFPEKLFWPLVNGFDHSFYTSIGNSILISDNLEELKKSINDIDEEETWGKSVSYNKFLEGNLLESNVNVYINTPKIWTLLSSKLHPRWRQFLRDNQLLLRSLQMGAIQFSHLNGSYYTNISWSYKSSLAAPQENIKREKFITNLSAPTAGLYAVKSHVNRADEMLVQDSLNDLTLITNEGEVLWKVAIGNPIVGEVHQIDFFSNGKLQYFFATRDALHVVDRLGNYVDPFPLHISMTDIEYASVVDYDHSKKYRFLVADKNGRLSMYDKKGTNLDGWQLRDVGGALVAAPQHHRIKGKDYVIAIRKDGVAYLMNRRGENIRNFPLNLEAKPSGDYFLENGNSISDTYFVVVTRDGYRIRFTVEGKIQSKETLTKTSFNTQFSLIKERSGRSYLILQQDAGHFNLLNEEGKQLISNEFIGNNRSKIKYYDFGAGRIYVSVTDVVQDLSYVYDGTGNLLTAPPIESSLLELRPKDADEYKLFFINGKRLVIQLL